MPDIPIPQMPQIPGLFESRVNIKKKSFDIVPSRKSNKCQTKTHNPLLKFPKKWKFKT